MTPQRTEVESDADRKARQRAEVAAWERDNDRVPGSAYHLGDGPHGGPTGGITWEGQARMARARLVAYGWAGLDDTDREAFRRHPGYVPDDIGPEPEPSAVTLDTDQFGLPAVLPDMDGATYLRHRDYERLGAQARRVWDVISDGDWHTLASLSAATGDPEASISARIRDFRKDGWGGHAIERRNLGGGLWAYRLVGG